MKSPFLKSSPWKPIPWTTMVSPSTSVPLAPLPLRLSGVGGTPHCPLLKYDSFIREDGLQLTAISRTLENYNSLLPHLFCLTRPLRLFGICCTSHCPTLLYLILSKNMFNGCRHHPPLFSVSTSRSFCLSIYLYVYLYIYSYSLFISSHCSTGF